MDSKQQRVTIVVERLRITSGSGPASPRTGNPGERVGAIDIRCPRTNPICPNGT